MMDGQRLVIQLDELERARDGGPQGLRGVEEWRRECIGLPTCDLLVGSASNITT
jgi:hypothetical protein